MARRRRKYNNDDSDLIGLFVLFGLGGIYTIVKRYWWLFLIIIIIIITYALVRFLIDLDLKGTLKKPIVYFQGKNNEKRLEQLKENETENKTKIYYLKRGIYGENNLLYTLVNSTIPMYIMHDLLLSCGEFKAQIDFIVITKKNIYVLESKNLSGNIDIENDGTFTRKIGKYKKGIKNPLTQNLQHELVLNNIFKIENIKDKYESLVVLTNDDTYLKFKKSENDYKGKIIRNDKIIETLNKKENKRHRIRNEEQVKNVCDLILKYDISKSENEIKDEDLLKYLKFWRLSMANLEEKEAYMIFNDITLNELVLKKPTTLDQLKEINGFGSFKAEKYGKEIIKIIEKYK